MDAKTGFFYLFSVVMLFAAFRVVTARNPVHAVLYLILAFSQAAGIWLLLKAEFLGIALVVVYLGAVMVLFMFVVMMLDIRIERLKQGFWKHSVTAAIVGALIALEMALVLINGFGTWDEVQKPMEQVLDKSNEVSNTLALGRLLYTQYIYPVEIAAVLLLVAMIAAIALTLRQRKDINKSINPAIQVRVRAEDRVSLVKMQATKAAVAPTAVEGEAAVEEKK